MSGTLTGDEIDMLITPSADRGRSDRSARAAATDWLTTEGEVPPRNPIVGSFGNCCACAASGHASAPPPSSVMTPL